MTLKSRIATLEVAQYEQELDRCVRYLAEKYRRPAAEVREELEAIARRREAEGGPLSPDELKQAEEVRQEMDAWEANRG
jgi:hypothetical protein